jgi:hypothetical protein
MPASLWLPANGNPFLLPNQRSLQAGLIPGIKFKLGGGKAAIMQSPAIYLTQAGSLGHESPLNTASRINIYKYTPPPHSQAMGAYIHMYRLSKYIVKRQKFQPDKIFINKMFRV